MFTNEMTNFLRVVRGLLDLRKCPLQNLCCSLRSRSLTFLSSCCCTKQRKKLRWLHALMQFERNWKTKEHHLALLSWEREKGSARTSLQETTSQISSWRRTRGHIRLTEELV